MLTTQQEGYPCSPHCAGYLRELEQRKEIDLLRGLVKEAERELENVLVSIYKIEPRRILNPTLRRLRDYVDQQRVQETK